MSLENAFRSFEEAAGRLARHHDTLGQRVERLEGQLVAVLDAVGGGVAVVARDGRLLRTNRTFDRLGLTDEVAGLIGGTTRFRHLTQRGERDLSVSWTAVDDPLTAGVLTVQDVTEIRREEQEGGRRNRLEALGRMAAELAHEVRNPLGSIRLFSELLRDDLADRREQHAMVSQILGAVAGLEGTVANLLAFAAPGGPNRESLDLSSLAAEACALIAPACEARGVRLEIPAIRGCPMQGDAEGLRRVVLNLLANALAATPAGGDIRIRVEHLARTALLEVVDDGSGIHAADLPRVFDPFFSKSDGGTGLGLSIVHGTVERHGGRITLDSEPGRGTCVRVELPLTPAEVRDE